MSDVQLVGVEPRQWSDLLRSWPADRVDIYDLPSYFETWAAYEAAEPVCLKVDAGSLTVLYPFFKKKIDGYELDADYFDISSAYGYGGPASNRDPSSPDETKRVNEAIDQWLSDNRVIAEFIRCSPYRPPFKLRDASYTQVRANVEVELSSEEDAWARLESAARRNIRSASNTGLVAKVDDALESVDKFIVLYGETARRLDMSAFYQFPADYFRRTADLLHHNSFIVNVEYQDHIVASGLCFIYGNRLHYHLGCSAADHLKLRPNDLMFWGMIRYGLRRGATSLELGGGIGMASDDTLFRFKRKFGDRILPTFIATKIHNQNVYDDLRAQWERRFPHLVQPRGKMFLQYRFSD